MARSETIYDNHLFNTWLEYRKERDNKSRAEVIRDINLQLGKKYTNSHIVEFLRFQKSITNQMSQMIDQDLPDMVGWLFKKKGYNNKKIDYTDLAEYLRSSTKRP